jgi:hypothetical protein
MSLWYGHWASRMLSNVRSPPRGAPRAREAGGPAAWTSSRGLFSQRIEEVDNGVLRVDGSFAPGSQEVVFAWSAGGCAFSCFAPTFLKIVEEGFLSGGSAMRCRVPYSSATDKMVPK